MMTTDKERAEVYRELADELPTDAYWNRSALTHKADQLDPPKPQWADGTIAWVTARTGKRYLSLRDVGRWTDGEGYPAEYICMDHEVTKVEPLRVLADDEVAVKRTKADYFGADFDNWRIEANGVAHHHPAAADLCRSYADALDAEAGEQS